MAEQPTGLVFDVQRFSVHDGPGIRTTVFLKGCPLRCPWCQNPESLRPAAELSFDAARCRTSCDCLRACERAALVAGATRVLRDRCDGCGACVSACAFGALELVGRRVTVDGLLAELERDRSFFESSGGGVTLSGGEPTLQLELIVALASALRERGIGYSAYFDDLAPEVKDELIALRRRRSVNATRRCPRGTCRARATRRG
ncbi:MAG: hypothetical protein A2138_19530 [Deltaproteobacteria bacterium RBG_16_71_12]|nr:MAG: hypothetical protein A2138_19530 [Deltaproteobacteria bacterium RBG_16_71_12]